MTTQRQSGRRPACTIVGEDDPRERPGAVEHSAHVSAEWARTVHATSHRPWANAAKVIALLAGDHPDARYVEGWASQGGVMQPMWHAWVDVPLGASELAWLRIDASPMWRWTMQHNRYCPLVEVRATELAPLVTPLLRPRGRARCPLPLAPLAPAPKLATFHPVPADSLGEVLGAAAAWRASALRASLVDALREQTVTVRADGQAELDRLAAMRVLPPE